MTELGTVPIRKVAWRAIDAATGELVRCPAIVQFHERVDFCQPREDKLFMAFNKANRSYRFFDVTGWGLHPWTHFAAYHHPADVDESQRFHGLIFSVGDQKSCKASAPKRAEFFASLLTVVESMEIVYLRDDPLVLSMLADECAAEFRRLVRSILFAYKRGELQHIEFHFVAEDSSNHDYIVEMKDAAAGTTNTVFDMQTGRLAGEQVNLFYAHYRRICRSEQHAVLLVPPVLGTAEDNNGRDDIRVWQDSNIRRLFAEFGLETIDSDCKGKTYFYHLVCEAHRMDAALKSVRACRYVPRLSRLLVAPVDHTFSSATLYRLLEGMLMSEIAWQPLPLCNRRFHAQFVALVNFVAALQPLALPTLVLDELVMWTGLGAHLLRVDRRRYIESTLASCRRVRDARASRNTNVKLNGSNERV